MLSPNGRSILCPHRGCEMQVGVVRGDRMGLVKGYRPDRTGKMWHRDPLEQLRGANRAPGVGAVVRCWSCRRPMVWPFSGTATDGDSSRAPF